jgi:hypothetical protein
MNGEEPATIIEEIAWVTLVRELITLIVPMGLPPVLSESVGTAGVLEKTSVPDVERQS